MKRYETYNVRRQADLCTGGSLTGTKRRAGCALTICRLGAGLVKRTMLICKQTDVEAGNEGLKPWKEGMEHLKCGTSGTTSSGSPACDGSWTQACVVFLCVRPDQPLAISFAQRESPSHMVCVRPCARVLVCSCTRVVALSSCPAPDAEETSDS